MPVLGEIGLYHHLMDMKLLNEINGGRFEGVR